MFWALRADVSNLAHGAVILTFSLAQLIPRRPYSPHESTTNLYTRHRFQAEMISHCNWLYFHFRLSDPMSKS